MYALAKITLASANGRRDGPELVGPLTPDSPAR